jgi:hypothetical protein
MTQRFFSRRDIFLSFLRLPFTSIALLNAFLFTRIPQVFKAFACIFIFFLLAAFNGKMAELIIILMTVVCLPFPPPCDNY